jgi:Flp pilus assembly pilin Flp
VIAVFGRVTNHRDHWHCTERAAAFPTTSEERRVSQGRTVRQLSFRTELSEGGESMISGLFRRLYVNALTLREEKGQTMAEYGVVLAVITIGIVATLILLSGGIVKALDAVVNVLKV